ncbi:interferon-induced protein 44-like [Leptonychotes weddellii]|uniref:Interferon-induced protein 44-like n=1 Tax=Leptonychotes weddellii TaxID=9713 RepID=A0A7F8QPC1_LEPWE|nr:interferon-induced protein 44-like [Leptonychotes weddellii]
MAVTTRLTWSEEKSLQKMLGNVSLRLLYKSSVHDSNISGIEDDMNYISQITRATKHRNPLLAELRAYKPCVDFISEVRILLLGPSGSGKSSFINSVKSVFRGQVTHQATVTSDVTSITGQYRIYPIKDGKDGKYLPFRLCDSMGLHEKEGVGLCVDDIPYILKGCVPDRYQLSPNKPITPNHPTCISSPSLKDRIHCVAYVLDINSINDLSSKMVAKFKQVQREVLSCVTACVLLLTKATNCSEFLQDNFLNMDKPMTSQSQIMHVSKMLNVPIYNTFVVENYTSEWELDPLKDSQILFVLRQMLQVAEDFFEDLP